MYASAFAVIIASCFALACVLFFACLLQHLQLLLLALLLLLYFCFIFVLALLHAFASALYLLLLCTCFASGFCFSICTYLCTHEQYYHSSCRCFQCSARSFNLNFLCLDCF